MKTKLFILSLLASSMMMIACANANDASSDIRLVNQNFYGIILNGNANVYLMQGDVNSVKVVSSTKAEEVKTKIVDGVLVISTGTLRDADVYVTIAEVNLLQVNGDGMIRAISPVNSDMLQLKVKGSGKIYADVRALSLAMTINGNGKIYVGGVAGELLTKIYGDGHVINTNLDTVHLASYRSYGSDTMFNHKSETVNN